MLGELRDLNARLDRDNLRVRRPHHNIFLCGGVIATVTDSKSVLSVRDYLYRVRKIERNIVAPVVLAESAQQLYRDTSYPDLISFEEDIAKISSIVLVISESPGSLAELGAFASENKIKETVRLLISDEHNTSESFVRFGPIKRIENINRNRIGVFPWKTHKKNGYVVKASMARHYGEICRFINDAVNAIPDSYSYSAVPDRTVFYDIVWLLSALEAVPPEPLYDAVRIIHPEISDVDIKNLLYTLRVCKWIDVFSYAGRDFYYLPVNRDPYEYSFLAGRRERDVPAKKVAIVREFQAATGIGKAVLKRLQEKRRGAA